MDPIEIYIEGFGSYTANRSYKLWHPVNDRLGSDQTGVGLLYCRICLHFEDKPSQKDPQFTSYFLIRGIEILKVEERED